MARGIDMRSWRERKKRKPGHIAYIASDAFHDADPDVLLAAMVFKQAMQDAQRGDEWAQAFLALPTNHPLFAIYWEPISEYVPISRIRHWAKADPEKAVAYWKPLGVTPKAS